jgi:hypothetical protein
MKSGREGAEGFEAGARRMNRIRVTAIRRRNGRMEFTNRS